MDLGFNVQDGPNGQLLSDDIECICKYSEGRIVVDLGTCLGKAAWCMSHNAIMVMSADVFENIEDIKNTYWRERYKDLQKEMPHTFEDVSEYFADFDNVTVTQSTTADFASSFEDNTVDFVFVDADHSYEGVLKDFRAWKNKVIKGGFMAFHDYTKYHPGVVKFIDGLKKRQDEFIEVDRGGSVIVFERIN